MFKQYKRAIRRVYLLAIADEEWCLGTTFIGSPATAPTLAASPRRPRQIRTGKKSLASRAKKNKQRDKNLPIARGCFSSPEAAWAALLECSRGVEAA
jgi:hypothetical protein